MPKEMTYIDLIKAALRVNLLIGRNSMGKTLTKKQAERILKKDPTIQLLTKIERSEK